jgi:hypothetical protein
MTSWEGHFAHPRLPMSMADKFLKAGFRFDGAAVFPILNLQIAAELAKRGIGTPREGRWHPTTIGRVLNRLS